MPTPLQSLPITILEQCSEYLNQESLSQLALVSKRLHAISRPQKSKPKHLNCTHLDQKNLLQVLRQITLHTQNSPSHKFIPLFNTLTFSLGKWGFSDDEAAEVKTGVQILRANEGVMRFLPQVTLEDDPASCDEELLSALSELAAAASTCKDSTSDVQMMGGNPYDAEPADFKVKAVFERLAQESVVTSVTLELLKLHDFRQSLETLIGVASLRTLNLSDCVLTQNSAFQIITLPGLETLIIQGTPMPIGIIIGNVASLQKLRIQNPWTEDAFSTKNPFRAHFPKLHDFTIQVNEMSSAECSIRKMLLFNINVSMPALRRIRSTVYHALTCAGKFESLLDRFPSLRTLILEEIYLNPKNLDITSTTESEPHGADFTAFIRACLNHNTTLMIKPSTQYCVNRTDVEVELQSIGQIRSALWSYGFFASIGAFGEAINLDEAISLPELRKLSLSLNTMEVPRYMMTATELEGLKVEINWGGNLAGMLRQISASRCQKVELTVSGRAGILGNTKSFLQDLALRTSLPVLGRVAGRCSVSVSRDVSLNPTKVSVSHAVNDLRNAISELEIRTGIDFSGFEVETT